MNMKVSLLIIPILFPVFSLDAQSVKYNLQQMLQDNLIETVPAYGTSALAGDKPGAITTKVKRFRNHQGEKFGLWSDGLPGDFANLFFRR